MPPNFFFFPSHSGRPRRQCEGPCAYSRPAPAGSTASARRRWSTALACPTSSWSHSRSSSAPTTLPKLPSSWSQWRQRRTTTDQLVAKDLPAVALKTRCAIKSRCFVVIVLLLLFFIFCHYNWFGCPTLCPFSKKCRMINDDDRMASLALCLWQKARVYWTFHMLG